MNISDHLKLQASNFEQVVQYLSRTRQTWLLVLDNADDHTIDLTPFFPFGARGTVITTSRNPECGEAYGCNHREQLDVLDKSLATNLLMRAAECELSSTNRKDGERIVKRLGCNTLAVYLAGSYVAKGYCHLNRYLDTYQKYWRRTVEHAPRKEKTRYGSVYATFEASIVILERKDGEDSCDALELLRILSTLATSNVPLMIFEDAWSSVARVAKTDRAGDLDCLSEWHISNLPGFLGASANEWDSYRLIQAHKTLEALAILTVSGCGVGRKLSMHPLLHEWTWRRQAKQQMEMSWAMSGSVMSLALYDDRAWRNNQPDYRLHLELASLPGRSTSFFHRHNFRSYK